MMEWKYTKQLWDDLDFFEIGLLELGTPLGCTETFDGKKGKIIISE